MWIEERKKRNVRVDFDGEAILTNRTTTTLMVVTTTMVTTTMMMAMMTVIMTMVACGSAAQSLGEKKFKDDIALKDSETGQEFELHSEGRVAQMVELDLIPEVTRVACVGNRVMVKMTDTTPARGWREGQVVVGGPGWGCNATRHNGFRAQAIYVRLVSVSFPLDTEVSLVHTQAGPFDMLEEAQIHFHYDPGKKTHPAMSRDSLAEKKGRFRRSVANLVSSILDHVDWHANQSTSIPFNLGESALQGSQPMTLALHKNWGQGQLNVTRGQDAEGVKDDFVLHLGKLNGDSELTYTFDLVIKNVDGEPQIVKYVNQYDLQTNVEAEATIQFQREIGVTYNLTLDRSPTKEILRVPLIRPRGGSPPLPPVNLVVSYNAVSAATLSAYSAGRASVSTAYNASGFVTAYQKFDPITKNGSDVTSRDWRMDSNEQSLRSPHRTHVDFSIYQKLSLISAVQWKYQDVDIELSPPMEITVRPEVTIRSSSPGLSRCVNSSLTVRAHVHAGKADFTADAFGLHLWDIPLQPAMTRELHLVEGHLGKGCQARCHSPSHVISEALNTTQQIGRFGRQDPEFRRLRVFTGDQVRFQDSAVDATWCGRPGGSCHPCSQNATGTSASSMTCASRLMTSRAVAALTLLADLASAEWPEKRLLVLEAWDEPTSEHPTGRHDERSLHRAGRALALSLLADHGRPLQSVPLSESLELNRLAQLAVCAGFELVERVTNGSGVRVGVAEDGWSSSADPGHDQDRIAFWEDVEGIDVSELSPKCARAPRLSENATWPPNTEDPALRCGPPHAPLHRGNRAHMNTLIHWNFTGTSLTFKTEGQATEWCGYLSRPCRDLCDTPLNDLEPWDWCSTRMMTPRLAIRLRKLQKLAEEKNIDIQVLQAFSETSWHQNNSVSLYHEGRAVKLTSGQKGQLSELASLAVCAGFDMVAFTTSDYVEAFVRAQSGYRAVLTAYFEGPSYPAVAPVGTDGEEYSYPQPLKDEDLTPTLLDGGLPPDTPLSQHLRLADVMSTDGRYFRLDPSLLECLELAEDDFSGTIQIIPDSMYRTRSANMRRNLDLRHPQELWRFQSGQAVEVRPAGTLSSERLLALATSILRECPAVVRLQTRALGLGCHGDRLYIDLRPLVAGHERVYVMVWEEEGGKETGYCRYVKDLQRNMIEGGPVVQSVPAIACPDRRLEPGLEFLSFQMGQKSHCHVPDQKTFCGHSREAREKVVTDLKNLLTSAAGHGRLDLHVLGQQVKTCLVTLCGGCPGVGPVFDDKVRACSSLVHHYVSRAASPLPPDLTNRTTFYNVHTVNSTLHSLACGAGSVCLVHTPLYSLFAPTVTARYYPDPKKPLERALFAADVNPTPLLEVVTQEIAYRAKGKVTVYIENDGDTHVLRNLLKVLMVYNKNVTLVEFHVAPTTDSDMVTSSIQRKLETWSGVTCPRDSRFALTPFRVVTIGTKRQRRSAELSMERNEATASQYDWEQEWLESMF
ncbi:hypothetical protein ACOMHN_032777 [Nucella lapillus]